MLSEKINQKKCDCEQLNQQRKNLRENEKKAAEEQIQTLVSKNQSLEASLRDSQHVERTLEARLKELTTIENDNLTLKK